MTKLSVNINKIATLRNSRGGDVPNVVKAAIDIQDFGGQGITVHPRPDERHIRYQDVYDLKPVVRTEFNIEGKPIPKFMDVVLSVKPTQVTLVPDAENALTSNAGWDTLTHQDYLKEVIAEFKNAGIRTSIFIDTDVNLIEAAAKTGTDRIELYTEHFASEFEKGNKAVVESYAKAAEVANACGMPSLSSAPFSPATRLNNSGPTTSAEGDNSRSSINLAQAGSPIRFWPTVILCSIDSKAVCKSSVPGL